MANFKRIEQYTEEELSEAITTAINHCGEKGLDFWKIHRGFFAYLEQRARKDAAASGHSGAELKEKLKASVENGKG